MNGWISMLINYREYLNIICQKDLPTWQMVWVEIIQQLPTLPNSAKNELSDIKTKIKDTYENKKDKDWVDLSSIEPFWDCLIQFMQGEQILEPSGKSFRADFATLIMQGKVQDPCPLQFHVFQIDCKNFPCHTHTIFPSPRTLLVNCMTQKFYTESVLSGYEAACAFYENKFKRQCDSCLAFELLWNQDADAQKVASLVIDGSSAGGAVFVACLSCLFRTPSRPKTCYSLTIDSNHQNLLATSLTLTKSLDLDRFYEMFVIHVNDKNIGNQFSVPIKTVHDIDDLYQFAFRLTESLNKLFTCVRDNFALTDWTVEDKSGMRKVKIEELYVDPYLYLMGKPNEKFRWKEIFSQVILPHEKSERIFVIQGRKGLGKTTLGKWAAYASAQENLERMKNGEAIEKLSFVLYVDIDECEHYISGGSFQFEKYIKDKYEIDAQDFRYFLQECGRVVFFIDHFDRVQNRGPFIEWLQDLLNTSSKCTFIFTWLESDRFPFEKLPYTEAVVYHLRPWDPIEAEKLWEKWKNLNAHLLPSAYSLAFEYTPFFLNAIGFLARSRVSFHDIMLQLALKFIERGLNKSTRSADEVLRELKQFVWSQGEYTPGQKPALKRIYKFTLRDNETDWFAMVLEGGLIRQVGISRTGNPLYTFFHSILADFIFALALAEKIENSSSEQWLNELARRAQDPAWENVLIFLAGALEENPYKKLLQQLVDETSDDLFRHRFVLALRMKRYRETKPQMDRLYRSGLIHWFFTRINLQYTLSHKMRVVFRDLFHLFPELILKVDAPPHPLLSAAQKWVDIFPFDSPSSAGHTLENANNFIDEVLQFVIELYMKHNERENGSLCDADIIPLAYYLAYSLHILDHPLAQFIECLKNFSQSRKNDPMKKCHIVNGALFILSVIDENVIDTLKYLLSKKETFHDVRELIAEHRDVWMASSQRDDLITLLAETYKNLQNDEMRAGLLRILVPNIDPLFLSNIENLLQSQTHERKNLVWQFLVEKTMSHPRIVEQILSFLNAKESEKKIMALNVFIFLAQNDLNLDIFTYHVPYTELCPFLQDENEEVINKAHHLLDVLISKNIYNNEEVAHALWNLFIEELDKRERASLPYLVDLLVKTCHDGNKILEKMFSYETEIRIRIVEMVKHIYATSDKNINMLFEVISKILSFNNSNEMMENLNNLILPPWLYQIVPTIYIGMKKGLGQPNHALEKQFDDIFNEIIKLLKCYKVLQHKNIEIMGLMQTPHDALVSALCEYVESLTYENWYELKPIISDLLSSAKLRKQEDHEKQPPDSQTNEKTKTHMRDIIAHTIMNIVSKHDAILQIRETEKEREPHIRVPEEREELTQNSTKDIDEISISNDDFIKTELKRFMVETALEFIEEASPDIAVEPLLADDMVTCLSLSVVSDDQKPFMSFLSQFPLEKKQASIMSFFTQPRLSEEKEEFVRCVDAMYPDELKQAFLKKLNANEFPRISVQVKEEKKEVAYFGGWFILLQAWHEKGIRFVRDTDNTWSIIYV